MLNMKTETDLKKEAEAGLKIRIDFSLLIHSFNQIHLFRLSFNQIQIHVVRVRRSNLKFTEVGSDTAEM